MCGHAMPDLVAFGNQERLVSMPAGIPTTAPVTVAAKSGRNEAQKFTGAACQTLG